MIQERSLQVLHDTYELSYEELINKTDSNTLILHQLKLLIMETYKSFHYNDVIMGSMASQITSPAIVYSAVYSGADQRKHQSSAALVLVRGIHQGPVNSPYKWPVTRKMFPFDDVIMVIFKLNSTHHERRSNKLIQPKRHSTSNGLRSFSYL